MAPHVKVKVGEPLDVEELCRRLRVQERRQRDQAERRRRRATKDLGQRQYHHIPQVAAQDFARTATPDTFSKRETHPLSRQVMDRFRNNVVHPKALSATGLAAALERAQAELREAAERNQFQRSRALEEAAQADKDRDLHRPLKRDFRRLSHLMPQGHGHNRRRSFSAGDAAVTASDIDTGEGLVPMTAKRNPRHSIHVEDRHDWSQNDESERERRPSFRERVSPLIKKTEAIFISKSKRDRCTAEVEAETEPEPEPPPDAAAVEPEEVAESARLSTLVPMET
ncbi:MAG: hypothetical protein M1838_002377 [Thelocarpon superellum]|nr:MAG: hypothetical protein M1838_002377 [Thelocarpon superellum]